MTEDLEVVGRVVIDDIVMEGLDTAEHLESAVYSLTEWLNELDLQAGDELVVVRRKEAPRGALPTDPC